MDVSLLASDALPTMAAFKLALLRWVERARLDAIAIQCWSALQSALGIFPCFVNGELTELGVPVACETDIHGALTSLMAQAAALWTQPTFFADLTVRHPENENVELLWHCSPFPQRLMAEGASPYVHHCRGIYGRLATVLHEVCKYIPGVKPDPVQPTAEEIAAHWRGADPQ